MRVADVQLHVRKFWTCLLLFGYGVCTASPHWGDGKERDIQMHGIRYGIWGFHGILPGIYLCLCGIMHIFHIEDAKKRKYSFGGCEERDSVCGGILFRRYVLLPDNAVTLMESRGGAGSLQGRQQYRHYSDDEKSPKGNGDIL